MEQHYQSYPTKVTVIGYAGFWKRFVAFILDTLVIGFGSFIVGFGFGLVLVALRINDETTINFLARILGLIVSWAYYAGFESSPTQATLGKMALGIKVTDMNGRRIGFGQATGRFFGKIISGLILLVGYIMIAFTEKKQGLHDILSGCLVINSK